jgi:hypothetical protein
MGGLGADGAQGVGPLGLRRVGSVDSGLGADGDDWSTTGGGGGGVDGDKKSAHKQRFVWTAELHRR